MALRGRHERPIGEVDESGRSYDLVAEVGMRDDLRAVFADVARLPDEQRAALVLAELGDLSHEEIARVVGCPSGKIKALVFQARASLRKARDARETPCAEIRELLNTLRGPALGRATLRRHLSDCPSCRAYRDVVRSRRGRLGARLHWGPIIGLKRYVAGAVSGSGSGAGASALTGGALGGAGLAAAALVTVAIPVSGSTDHATAVRDGEERVRPVAHAAPVTLVAQRAKTRAPAEHAHNRQAPSAPLTSDDAPGRTGGDIGETEADAPPAPQETAAGGGTASSGSR